MGQIIEFSQRKTTRPLVWYEVMIGQSEDGQDFSVIIKGVPSNPAALRFIADDLRRASDAVSDEGRLNQVVETARNLRDSLSGGFVACSRCGEQEPTDDLDGLSELDAALKAHDEHST